ncbi:MAG: TonB-dependent receptor [Bacteroidales bacterium]|jgi:hemoglobin/transferrin/lactoferrin receptor protein|nr:TonB-dependent receptor [Bacteroidales bacterium]
MGEIIAQEVTQPPVALEKLGRNDLIFSIDTSEMSVMSASRSSKLISELPITIHVVTREDIERNHYTSLTDVLKSLPGIRVSQPGNGELGETFQLRGLTGNMYTMILINGMPVKPSVVKGMPVMAQLPVRQAERIEIIYGPAAAVYGADAVSGVVNIITREADKGTFALADISLGENKYRNSNFMVGGKAGRNKNILRYSFYGSLTSQHDFNVNKGYEEVYNPLHYLQNRGYRFDIGGEPYEPLQITEEAFGNVASEINSFIGNNYPVNYDGSLTLPRIEALPAESNLLGFNLRFRDFSFSFNNMYRKSHSSLGQSSYLFRFDNPQTFWGENISQTTLSYSHPWSSKFSTTTNLSSLIYRMDNNSSHGVNFIADAEKVYRYSAGNDVLFEQLFTVIPRTGLEIISGITYQFSGNLPQTSYLYAPFDTEKYGTFSGTVEAADPVSGTFGLNPLTYHNFGLFSQTYWSYGKLRFMGGLRLDRNSVYGVSFSPRLAGLFIHNSKTTSRASVGFAFKAPPASLAYQSLAYKAGGNLDSLIYMAIPNPDLVPEKYMSVEMGFIRALSPRTTLNLSIYYNEIRNLIMEKSLPLDELDLPRAIIENDTSSVLTRANNKKAVSRLYGLQGTFLIRNIVKKINLNAELSLTLARSSEKFPDVFEMAGQFLSDFTLMPNHFGQLRVTMEPAENLFLNITSIWESNWLRIIMPFEELYNDLFKGVDGFYSMDVTLTYSIGSNLNTFLKVTNLFDERYGGPVYSELGTPLPYSPQAGRTISAGLTYRLN